MDEWEPADADWKPEDQARWPEQNQDYLTTLTKLVEIILNLQDSSWVNALDAQEIIRQAISDINELEGN